MPQGLVNNSDEEWPLCYRGWLIIVMKNGTMPQGLVNNSDEEWDYAIVAG